MERQMNLRVVNAAADAASARPRAPGLVERLYRDHWRSDINRYRTVKISIDDEALKDRRVTTMLTLNFVDASPVVDTPFDLKEGSGGTFSNVEIASTYTGACFSSGAVNSVSASDFSSFEYACNDNLSLLPTSTPVTGFPNGTFWAGYPGTCN